MKTHPLIAKPAGCVCGCGTCEVAVGMLVEPRARVAKAVAGNACCWVWAKGAFIIDCADAAAAACKYYSLMILKIFTI
jgi:hypothetical protein